MVALMLCVGLVIFRRFFNTSKKLTVYSDNKIEMHEIQLHLQSFMWADNNQMVGHTWPVGHSLDIPESWEAFSVFANTNRKISFSTHPGTLILKIFLWAQPWLAHSRLWIWKIV